MIKTDLDCLVIPQEILVMDIDFTTKAILAYLHFRSNHPSLEWTFSQADMVNTLHIPQKTLNRHVKILEAEGILKRGNSIKTTKGFYIPMTLEPAALKTFIQGRVSQNDLPQGSVVQGRVSQNDLPTSVKMTEGVSQNDLYKNDTKKNEVQEKNDRVQESTNVLSTVKPPVLKQTCTQAFAELTEALGEVESEEVPLPPPAAAAASLIQDWDFVPEELNNRIKQQNEAYRLSQVKPPTATAAAVSSFKRKQSWEETMGNRYSPQSRLY